MLHRASAALARSPRLRVYLPGALHLERETCNRAASTSSHRRAGPLHLPTHKCESLPTYLILHPDPLPRDHLAALLWRDFRDDLAKSLLRRALVLRRQVLDERAVLADRVSVQPNPAFPVRVDAREFKTQAEVFPHSNNADSAIKLDPYRGDLLAAFDDDWIEPMREHLRSLHLNVSQALAQRYRARANCRNC